jgi:hypothetical protein
MGARHEATTLLSLVCQVEDIVPTRSRGECPTPRSSPSMAGRLRNLLGARPSRCSVLVEHDDVWLSRQRLVLLHEHDGDASVGE